MAKSARAQLDGGLVTVEKGAAAPRNGTGAPQPKRVTMTFRITETAHRQLRRLAFETDVSQQWLVDQALGKYFDERGVRT
jgi:hypothetical protein